MSEAADRSVAIALEDELASSFGRYAQYTILERAIPDIRDGLKPVQRRILYAMLRSGNLPDRPYRKCAKTVGEVMGNFHPHGDQSIYDALVRMAQEWKLRLPLVDGHGNFGSLDDDPAAAMRYTEARLAPAALALLADIDEDTVPFRPNFDESSEEPVVLPAALPALVVNGASGVSAGFATEIPPHNLREVAAALRLLIDRPEAGLDEVMKHVPAPDFPTGGLVLGGPGLREVYATGHGRIDVRARITVEEERRRPPRLAITELPYGVVKSDLVAQLDELRLDGPLRGLADVRDESDRQGVRVVVELERSADPPAVLAYLYRKTMLQIPYAVHMVAIAAGAPRLSGLLELLHAFLAHRREVVRRRGEYRRARARRLLEEAEGLIRALDILDEVIATIRASRDRGDARQNLISRFGFSEIQAERIVDLRLHRLTTLSIVELREETEGLRRTIQELTAVLDDPRRLAEVLRRELREVGRELGDQRRSEVVAPEATPATPQQVIEVLVPAERVVVTLTRDGYLKRVGPRSEQEPEKLGARPGDVLAAWFESNTRHTLLLFSAQGQCYSLPVHAVPEARWSEPGTALPLLLPIGKDDAVVAALACAEPRDDLHFLLVTAGGKVKRTPVAEFSTNRRTGVLAMRLEAGDRVVAVLEAGNAVPEAIRRAIRAELGAATEAVPATPAAGESEDLPDLLLVTAGGMAIRFPLAEVSVQGRPAGGIRAIAPRSGDEVMGALLVPAGALVTPPPAWRGELGSGEEMAAAGRGCEVVLFGESGRARATVLGDYPGQRRGGRGTGCLPPRSFGARRLVAVRVRWPFWWPARRFFLVTSAARYVAANLRLVRSGPRDGSLQAIADLPALALARGERVLGVLDDPRDAGPGADGEQDSTTQPGGEGLEPASGGSGEHPEGDISASLRQGGLFG